MNISGTHSVIATFYRFVSLDNLRDIKKQLLLCCNNYRVKGTILIAHEGINGTIAGSRVAINQVVNYLVHTCGFSDMEYKESSSQTIPFYRMKVKIKKEIVSMGIHNISPLKKAGIRVDPKNWNKLIEDPEVLVLDTRNQYEYTTGTFKNAVSPNTCTFNEFPRFVDQELKDYRNSKIAMFCTGGIRCEKATSYLLEQGFSNVYHLQGGILKYLEEINPEENLWQGECFVFDNRVAIDKNLGNGTYEMCYGCRMPLSKEDRKTLQYAEGISCPYCYDYLTEKKRARLQERQHQIRLAKSRNKQHIGIPVEIKNHKRENLDFT